MRRFAGEWGSGSAATSWCQLWLNQMSSPTPHHTPVDAPSERARASNLFCARAPVCGLNLDGGRFAAKWRALCSEVPNLLFAQSSPVENYSPGQSEKTMDELLWHLARPKIVLVRSIFVPRKFWTGLELKTCLSINQSWSEHILHKVFNVKKFFYRTEATCLTNIVICNICHHSYQLIINRA